MSPQRAKTICRRTGCNAYAITYGGYCQEHYREPENSLRKLDDKKTDETRRFYQGSKWTKTSRAYRRRHPLCERCKKNGKTAAAQLVHHDPPLEKLLADGLNPYDWQYLESMCNLCHMGELRGKRKA